MFKFRPVTARIEDFHERIRNRALQTDSERAMIITESYKKNEHIVPIIRRCMATYDVCDKMTLRVEDFSIFVGNKGKTFCGSGTNPEWFGGGWVPFVVANGEWGDVQADGLYHNPETEELKLTVSPEDVENFKMIAEFWNSKTITTMANAWQPDGYDELCRLNVCKNVPGGPLMMMTAGHLTPGYPRLIQWGYGKIRKFAQDWLDEHRCDMMGDSVSKYLFYKGVTIMCDAVSNLIRRYAALCADKAAECNDTARKAELTMMSDGLNWIAENPPRSYWEACQTMLIYQLFLNIENMYPAPSFGRFDQLTWPLLKNDLDNGRLTLDEAQEITDYFFLHANTFYVGFPGKGLAATTGIGNTYQHTTIGGCDPKTGKDATNPVSYMVLETVGRLGLHDPTVSLRTGKDTPDELWDCAIETTKLVGGLPLFQNDDVIIPGLIRELEFELEDARDYCFIGCQEITGHGNDYSAGNGISPPNASIHYATVIDIALNNGVNPFNNEQCSVKTGYLYDMKSMDEVRAAVKKVAAYVTKAQVSFDNYTEYLTQHYATTVGLSLSMIGCLESGKDCTWGGAKYNSYGGTATGLATIADSLATIKYMCFDKKLCTTRELYDAFMANWEGYESLRQQILNEVPHFGNNDPYADEEMKWICDTYYDICQQCNSTRSKHYKSGLYGASDHVAQGQRAWATPDGRKTGDPIADASSPAQGRDISGPTAVLLSECCFDHSRFMDGLALNIRIHPTALNGADGTAKLRDLTKAYLANGGMEVQYNVVSSETMRAAQADPDAYRNLVVRIAGYSAYFVELNRECQNDLIARTENSF